MIRWSLILNMFLLFGKKYCKDIMRNNTQRCSTNGKWSCPCIWTEIQTTDIVKGNLFQQLENSLEILRTKYLHSKIKYEGIHRRDILEYPYEALREAIINALIHRDYWGTSHLQIRVYPDKLVIMNEGSLPPEVPVGKLKTNHLSKLRNRLLADIMNFWRINGGKKEVCLLKIAHIVQHWSMKKGRKNKIKFLIDNPPEIL